MADDVTLTLEPRTERGSRPAGRLRRAGRVPAVVYGLGAETLAVTAPARELGHILSHGANTLITLEFESGKPALALARQVQRHAVRGELLHVDFIRVRTDVAVAAEVNLHLEGEAVGAKDGGLVEQLVFQLPIEAKPQDIPHALSIDVSALEIGGQLHVSDVALPAGVSTTLEPDVLVVQVVAPRIQEEEEAVEGEAVEGEGGEEGAAGDAIASAGGDKGSSDGE